MKIQDVQIKKYEKIIHRIINDLTYMPNNVEYEDLVQIGRIALWQALESYNEGNGYSIVTHCYRIVQCDILDWLKSQQAMKRKKVEINSTNTFNDSFESDIHESMLINEIKRIVSNELYVKMFIDKYVNKYTYPLLVEKYNIPQRTIERIIQRVKIILKDQLIWQ